MHVHAHAGVQTHLLCCNTFIEHSTVTFTLQNRWTVRVWSVQQGSDELLHGSRSVAWIHHGPAILTNTGARRTDGLRPPTDTKVAFVESQRYRAPFRNRITRRPVVECIDARAQSWVIKSPQRICSKNTADIVMCAYVWLRMCACVRVCVCVCACMFVYTDVPLLRASQCLSCLISVGQSRWESFCNILATMAIPVVALHLNILPMS